MVILGKTVDGNAIHLTSEARRQGTYLIGATGTGKTTLLKQIICQDMEAGEGLCVIDPHGDLTDELLALVPQKRANDVILFAPGDHDQSERPLGINIFDCNRNDPRQKRRVTSTIIDTLRKLFFYSWGPRMEDLLRHAILTLLEHPDTTLLDLWLLLASPKHRAKYTAHLHDKALEQFWSVQFAGYAANPRDLNDLVGSSLNKIGRFIADPHMRRIVAQPKTAVSLRQIMDGRQLLFVNLSEGDLGEDNSSLLGAVIVNLILIAALTRRDTPPKDRVPCHLIVDEYQSFATGDMFPILQAEARKFGISTIVAHQYRDQLDDLNRGSTLNVADFIVFRVSGIDSHEIATQFDNTPPQPEDETQPKVVPSRLDSRYYEPTRVYEKVPGKPRPYSDVAAEHANTLARLDNLEAWGRIVEDKRLVEYRFHVERLEDDGCEETAARIRESSLKRGVEADEVDQQVADRIGNVDFDTFTPNPFDQDEDEETVNEGE